MKRWTNGLPGATKRLGAMMALQGLSLSQPRMRADTHDGPEQIAPLQRSDTLIQLSRSLSWKSILYRTAGPYIWHEADIPRLTAICPLSGAGSTDHCNTARSLSAGVSKPKVFRGR